LLRIVETFEGYSKIGCACTTRRQGKERRYGAVMLVDATQAAWIWPSHIPASCTRHRLCPRGCRSGLCRARGSISREVSAGLRDLRFKINARATGGIDEELMAMVMAARGRDRRHQAPAAAIGASVDGEEAPRLSSVGGDAKRRLGADQRNAFLESGIRRQRCRAVERVCGLPEKHGQHLLDHVPWDVDAVRDLAVKTARRS
jgi:hypothetical protein